MSRFAVCLFVCCAPTNTLASFSDKNTIISTLKRQHAELERCYHGLVFKGEMFYSRQQRRREFAILPEMCRIVTVIPATAGPSTSDPVTVVFLRSGDRFYELEKKRSDFVITSSGRYPPPKQVSAQIVDFAVSPYSSFMFLGRRLTEWIEDPDFVVGSVIVSAGRADLDFDYNPSKPFVEGESYRRMKGKITLDTSNRWSILKVEMINAFNTGKAEEKRATIIDVVYGTSVGDVTVPKACEYRLPERKLVPMRFQVSEVNRVDLTEADFTPKAFGIDVSFEEPPSTLARPARRYWWFYVAGAGVVILALTWFLRRNRVPTADAQT